MISGVFGRKKSKDHWLETQHSRVSSATLILENGIGQVLVVKASYKPYWTFPGGIVDRGETPKTAVIRETLEEVGILVESAAVTFVAVVDRKSDFANTYQFIFRALLTEQMLTEITLQTSEIEDYDLITKENAASGDRHYGKVIDHWMQGRMGYIEQTFGKDDQ